MEICEAKFEENNRAIANLGVFISDRDSNGNFSEGFESDNPRDKKDKNKSKVKFYSGHLRRHTHVTLRVWRETRWHKRYHSHAQASNPREKCQKF